MNVCERILERKAKMKETTKKSSFVGCPYTHLLVGMQKLMRGMSGLLKVESWLGPGFGPVRLGLSGTGMTQQR